MLPILFNIYNTLIQFDRNKLQASKLYHIPFPFSQLLSRVYLPLLTYTEYTVLQGKVSRAKENRINYCFSEVISQQASVLSGKSQVKSCDIDSLLFINGHSAPDQLGYAKQAVGVKTCYYSFERLCVGQRWSITSTSRSKAKLNTTQKDCGPQTTLFSSLKKRHNYVLTTEEVLTNPNISIF